MFTYESKLLMRFYKAIFSPVRINGIFHTEIITTAISEGHNLKSDLGLRQYETIFRVLFSQCLSQETGMKSF